MKRIRVHVLMVLAAVLLVMVACGPAATPTPTPPAVPTATPVPKIVKFGASLPLSGAAAPGGVETQRIFELSAEYINSHGGFKVKGETYNWKVVSDDNKYTGTGAVTVANRLIFEEGIKFLNSFGTPAALATASITAENKVINFGNTSAWKGFVAPDMPLNFMSVGSPSLPKIDYIARYGYLKGKGITRIAIVNATDDRGKAGSQGAQEAAPIAGIELVADEFYEVGTMDFYPLLTRIIAKNPQLIDTGRTGGQTDAVIVKQARELGYKGTFLLYGPVQKEFEATIPEKDREGIYTWLVPLEEFRASFTPRATWIVNEWEKRWPGQTIAFAIQWGYSDLLFIITEAIEKANSLDTTEVAKALETLEWTNSIGVKVHHSGKGLMGLNRHAIYPSPLSQYVNGKLVMAKWLQMPEF